jgi:hypothetical protein
LSVHAQAHYIRQTRHATARSGAPDASYSTGLQQRALAPVAHTTGKNNARHIFNMRWEGGNLPTGQLSVLKRLPVLRAPPRLGTSSVLQ